LATAPARRQSRFPAKWIPVRRKKTRQLETWSAGVDNLRAKGARPSAAAGRPASSPAD
jgi:hypothetical protein